MQSECTTSAAILALLCEQWSVLYCVPAIQSSSHDLWTAKCPLDVNFRIFAVVVCRPGTFFA